MKMKTYVLTLSRTFPKGHPREGEETGFAEKVKECLDWKKDEVKIDGTFKRHTIRADYDKWRGIADEVNAGRAELSVRQWLGEPRRSKQRELFRFDKDSGIGVERITEWNYLVDVMLIEDDFGGYKPTRKEVVANNDGLTDDDWRAWFRDREWEDQLCHPRFAPMAIIHFTKFRYCK